MVKIELSVFCTLTFLLAKSIVAQVVDISSYSINPLGIVEIEVNSTPTHYYCLQVADAENPNFFQTTSIALGGAESVTLSESLGALPLSRYRVLEYDIANPNDTDGDGLNDIAEMAENSGESPLNAAPSIDIEHGSVEMKSEEDFNILATNQNTTPWAYYYSLAPNPCHDVLYLRCRDCQDVEISVFNGLGQLCLLPDSFVLDASTFMFNVRGLPDGVYIIQGLPNGGSCGLKFIKQ
jgi:hypothetical protein